MIDGLKAYPTYKDSGVSWIGEVPEHWEVCRLKYLLRERDSRSIDGTEQLLRVSQYTGLTERKRADSGDEPDTRADSLVGYKRVEPNDLVVNIMLAWNGSLGVSLFPGITSPAYCVYQFGANARPWYFHYLLRSPAYKDRIKAVSTGVVESRLRLYTDDLFRLESTLPPPSEQAAIVRFLNHVDGRIRRYIRAKQRLIKLLEEEKQAIIHRAVTRGLDSNSNLKPSGVEWLGDVPAHWETCRVRYMTRILRGRFSHRPRNAPQFYDGEYPFIQTGDISAARKYIEGYSQTLNEKGLAISKMFPAGTLAMIITGAKTGHVAILGFDACFPDSAVGFLPLADRADTEFLFYLFITLKKELDQAAITSTQENLNVERIGGQVAAWPPLNEQKEIASYIRAQTSSLDESSVKALKQINLIREYRTRLIADVVTGKLDVREAAARSPEVAPEVEPLDEMEDMPEDDGTVDEELETADAA